MLLKHIGQWYNIVISVLALPRFVKGTSTPRTISFTQTHPSRPSLRISAYSVSAWLHFSISLFSSMYLKLEIISIGEISCSSHKSGNRVGSSRYDRGTTNRESSKSSRQSKKQNVTLAVTVGNTGISETETLKLWLLCNFLKIDLSVVCFSKPWKSAWFYMENDSLSGKHVGSPASRRVTQHQAWI